VTYSSTTYRLIISAPSDVPAEDLKVVTDAVNRWNAIYGRQFGAVVVPTHWQAHSAAEHGRRPQAALNTQLVEDADILVALLWHRLGSDTGEAESGTVEEITTAQSNGAYVAILRCTRDFPPSIDPEQITKLRAFYAKAEANSLMLGYGQEAELTHHVDAILSRAVTRDTTRAEAAAQTARGDAEVWPRIESSEYVKTDSKGRMRTRRRWQLVLTNTGAEPARHVRYRLETENEGDELPLKTDDERELEVLSPGGEAAYGLLMVMGTASQVRCIVTWEDSGGDHENMATLRLY